MTADITNISDVELEIDKVGELSSLSPRGGISLDQSGNNLAPPPRRKSFSRLRRRLSQTFRFSLNGSLAELSGGFNSGTFGDRQEKSMGKWIETKLRYSLNCLIRLKSEGRKQKIRLIILSHRNYFAILKRLILKEVPIKLNIYSPLQLYLTYFLLIYVS